MPTNSASDQTSRAVREVAERSRLGSTGLLAAGAWGLLWQVRHDLHPAPGWLALQGIVWLALAVWLGWREFRRGEREAFHESSRPSDRAATSEADRAHARRLAWAVAIALLSPFVWEWLARSCGVGEAPEVLWLVALQSVALIAAAHARHLRSANVAGLLSGFTVLVSLTIAANFTSYVVGVGFTLLLLGWLMARYWERIQVARSASHVEACRPVRRTVLVAGLAVALLAAAALGATSRTPHALSGFLPVSGGREQTDGFARSGVGDGDMLVSARDQALSFGPVDSELFLESDLPTLYDMFNDMYGDPPKPTQKTERTIALAAENVQELEQRVARSEKAGREFSALRQPSNALRAAPTDRPSPAILYVAGQVPVHLALERFTHFDGVTWKPGTPAHARPAPPVEQESGKAWYIAQRWSSTPLHRSQTELGVKIVNLRTNHIPTPPYVTSVHIDRAQEAGFIDWSTDGGLEIPGREFLPQLTVVHLRAATVDLTPLRGDDFNRAVLSRSPVDPFANARRMDERLQVHAATARAWTKDVPPGWRQVECIVQRLRNEYRLAPEVLPPTACDDVVAHFLTTGEGPDYLFATSAAVLLRSLGYPTRLVTGFYARDERYDRRHRHTPVLASDVHTWVEVAVDERTWAPIEPTPGYALPAEDLSWTHWAGELLLSGLDFLRRHATLLVAVALASVMVWRWRVPVVDAVMTLACYGWGRARRRERLHVTLRLLEWRGWLVGVRRPQAATVAAWYGRYGSALDDEQAAQLAIFLRGVDRELYAPRRHASPLAEDSCDPALQAADRVARALSARRLRQSLLEQEIA